jgi:hypothetical protein
VLGQFGLRQSILPPQSAQYAMLSAIEPQFFQQFVGPGVFESTDLTEQANHI